jgi:hypothetical protein
MTTTEVFKLEEIVGAAALERLLDGYPLIRWRQSTPHNWFIVDADGNSHCWHSYPGCAMPNLGLFESRSWGTSADLYFLKCAPDRERKAGDDVW